MSEMVSGKAGVFKPEEVRWQAHQNANAEMPENTMAAMRYAWELGGIPELDIRQTADGVIIGLHDETPKRTTTAPEAYKDKPVSQLTFGQIEEWDAGAAFSQKFKGEKIPLLAQVLKEVSGRPEREIYLDYKRVDLPILAELVRGYGVSRQVIFAHNDHDNCKTMKRLAPDIRTMLWISGGGRPEGIAERFQAALETSFAGLDIVQIHLLDADQAEQADQAWRYRVPRDFLQFALDRTSEAGVELEVLPYRFDRRALFALLDMGIRRFAVDEPKLFVDLLRQYC